MSRPVCCRRVGVEPECRIFKPLGVPVSQVERVVLGLDEFEAIRLADLEGLYQGDAAERMGISRATFGRIVEAARRKVAEALVNGCSLVIEGGEVTLGDFREFACGVCGHVWGAPFGEPRPKMCPSCACDGVEGRRGVCAHPIHGRRRCRKNERTE